MTTDAAVFDQLDDHTYQATEWARGPWDPGSTHGGAPSSLLAGVMEQTLLAAGDHPMFPTRMTLDLERPLGLFPVRVNAEVVRHGRKVRVVEATMTAADGTRIARASLLGIRALPESEQLDLSVAVQADPGAPPERPPARTVERAIFASAELDGPAFHSDAVEHRFTSGAMSEQGPGIDWIRLRVPVVAGSEPTPLQRVAAAADFGNGVSGCLPAGWMFINPDLTITLHRLPVGEWVCLDAATRLDPAGVGTAESALWDDHGPLGRSIQTLLVESPR